MPLSNCLAIILFPKYFPNDIGGISWVQSPENSGMIIIKIADLGGVLSLRWKFFIDDTEIFLHFYFMHIYFSKLSR